MVNSEKYIHLLPIFSAASSPYTLQVQVIHTFFGILLYFATIVVKVALESEIFEFGSNIRNIIFFHKRGLTIFKNSSIGDWMR